MHTQISEPQNSGSPTVKVNRQDNAWRGEIEQEGRVKLFTRPHESLKDCLGILEEKIKKLEQTNEPGERF